MDEGARDLKGVKLRTRQLYHFARLHGVLFIFTKFLNEPKFVKFVHLCHS